MTVQLDLRIELDKEVAKSDLWPDYLVYLLFYKAPNPEQNLSKANIQNLRVLLEKIDARDY